MRAALWLYLLWHVAHGVLEIGPGWSPDIGSGPAPEWAKSPGSKRGRSLDDGRPPKFYIYDWPAYIDDVWPPAGAALHNKSAYNHIFRPNNGAGQLLRADVGLFQTWQFSLYKNIIARMKVSRHRTLKPEEATQFIIPFDLGVHSYIDHLNGLPRLASPHGWMAQHLLRLARKDKELYWKYQGHNHFVFLGITAYQMVGIGVKTFFMQVRA